MFLRDIISTLGGEAIGEVPQSLVGVGTIAGADQTRITFFVNPKYRSALGLTQAGAVIVGERDRDSTQRPRIVAANPYAYFARVAQLFSNTATPAGAVHADGPQGARHKGRVH